MLVGGRGAMLFRLRQSEQKDSQRHPVPTTIPRAPEKTGREEEEEEQRQLPSLLQQPVSRSNRRRQTAPGQLTADVKEANKYEEPELPEGGCLPFGLSFRRRRQRAMTIDFSVQDRTVQQMKTSPATCGNERGPRSILRRPTVPGQDGDREPSSSRPRSRVRFANTVSVARVSIVQLKDDDSSPKRHRGRARTCDDAGLAAAFRDRSDDSTTADEGPVQRRCSASPSMTGERRYRRPEEFANCVDLDLGPQ